MRRAAKGAALFLAAAALAAVALSPWLLSWALVHDLLRPASRPLAPWVGWKTEASALSIASPSGAAPGFLVRPRGRGPFAGIVLVHGMVATGEEDWRLRRLAETLASGGFAVLAPAVAGLKRAALVEEDIAVVEAALEHLRERVEGVDPSRLGVVGISVGCGPALAAAASRPGWVAFAGAFGGYYDLAEVLKGLVVAGRALEGELLTTDRWSFFASNSHLASVDADRALLLGLARLPEAQRRAEAEALAGRLTPAGRALLELLTTEEPGRVEALLEAAGPAAGRLRHALSPRFFAHRLTMKLFLAHGDPDPVIPPAETLRLAASLPAGAEPTVAILPLFAHADPRSAGAGPARQLRSLRDLRRLISGLLEERP